MTEGEEEVCLSPQTSTPLAFLPKNREEEYESFSLLILQLLYLSLLSVIEGRFDLDGEQKTRHEVYHAVHPQRAALLVALAALE